MATSVTKEISDLPLVLKVHHIQETMGISRDDAYKLTHRADFPTVRIGRAIRIPRSAFFAWLGKQAEEGE